MLISIFIFYSLCKFISGFLKISILTLLYHFLMEGVCIYCSKVSLEVVLPFRQNG
jgi:hypothetical protein